MNLALLLTITIALSSSAFALVLHYRPRILKFIFFTLLGTSGLGAIWAGLSVLITGQNINYQINLGFPNIILQFALDPLSGFFLAIVGIIVISVACYGPNYKQRPITLVSFFTGLFVSSMYLVLLAHDVFSFMLAWELMSVSSYFLVVYHHEQAVNRHAALLYLLMAQASGLLILFAFSILTKFAGSMSFDVMHAMQFSPISPTWTSIAFFLAFFGFGMKAGIVPLHVWLPKAHPVAPSHISALMSGVMLKVAVYGFIRFTFGLLQHIYWQWGSIVLFIGVASALLGVLYALMQHDLKKLLAYHSVENIGIIFIGLGLSLIFTSTDHPVLAALGLIAALYHCLNHAIFKSLLFLGAGAIVQHSHEHDLERMGGLIKTMPYTAWCFLIGCISISALPPFNGFVSEWLIFQDAFQAVTLKSEVMRTLIPVSAALLALTSALAAACFVKAYGVIFLGQARTRHIRRAHDPRFGMRVALGFLAILCIFFGIAPTFTISLLNIIPKQLIGTQLPNTHNWLWLIPISTKTSSYNALLVMVGILSIGLVSYLLVRAYFGRIKLRSVGPWDCGFGGINSRMQYSATAFAMPLRRIFQSAWSIREKIEKTDSDTNYLLQINDRIWQYIYLPLERFSFALARSFAKLQGGNIRVYLAYTFVTLILLLWVIA
ncbi:MAG: hydrogenase 4 subunit B [bacterium]